MDGDKPDLKLEKVRRLQEELAVRGIDFEIRALSKKKLPHDRLLYSPTQVINMPPFTGAYGDHKHVSEYTTSNIGEEYFNELWKIAQKLEEIWGCRSVLLEIIK